MLTLVQFKKQFVNGLKDYMFVLEKKQFENKIIIFKNV